MNEHIETDLIVRRTGRILHITLNRPRVINALTPEMSIAIEEALIAAADDDSVSGVLLDGAGERGLCAGGDINMSISGDDDALFQFWKQEYALDLYISRYPKPYISIMDGITMGGGIGISAHASHRVVTERSRLALPEVRIGFIPDVGGTHLLSQAPGELGTHLALTAGDLDAGDALVCGFADHYIPSENLEDLKQALAFGEGSIDEEITRFAQPAPESRLLGQRDWIDTSYAGDDLEAILERLDEHADPEARAAAALIRQMSPTSVVLALAALRRARELNDLGEALQLELRLGEALLGTFDMREGVRAQIIDKDRNPQWRPARIEDVDRDWIRSLVSAE